MKIAVIQPRVSYFNGGGEKIPLESMTHLVELLDVSFDLYTTKSILPVAPGYELFKSAVANNSKVTIHEIPIPKKFAPLYKIEPGTNRYRWDAESLYFNNLVYHFLQLDKPDLILSYYLPDCIVKPPEIPSILYLLGYPRTDSEYREAMISQYDSVIAISKNTADQWNQRLNPLTDIQAILPQGLDLSSQPRLVDSFNDDFFHIVFAGRFMERKGIATILEAALLLQSNTGNVKFHLLGEGPMLQEIQAFISTHNLKKTVVIEGFKSNVLDYIKSAQLCVFPSYEGEGLMNVVLESMYYNGLVITTHGNGNEEIITNGKNGFLVNPHDAIQLKDQILSLKENYLKLSQIKKEAKTTISQNFTWKVHAQKFNSVCIQAIHEKNSQLSTKNV